MVDQTTYRTDQDHRHRQVGPSIRGKKVQIRMLNETIGAVALNEMSSTAPEPRPAFTASSASACSTGGPRSGPAAVVALRSLRAPLACTVVALHG